MRRVLLILVISLIASLAACGYERINSQPNLDYHNDIIALPDDRYNDDYESTVHPIIGEWMAISHTGYSAEGRQTDILALSIERGSLYFVEMPLIIRSDGTINVHGLDETTWNIRNGRFIYGGDMGFRYSFDEGRLVLTECSSDGSCGIWVFEKVE